MLSRSVPWVKINISQYEYGSKVDIFSSVYSKKYIQSSNTIYTREKKQYCAWVNEGNTTLRQIY